jgi:hypothetical protein
MHNTNPSPVGEDTKPWPTGLGAVGEGLRAIGRTQPPSSPLGEAARLGDVSPSRSGEGVCAIGRAQPLTNAA